MNPTALIAADPAYAGVAAIAIASLAVSLLFAWGMPRKRPRK